MFLFMDFPFGIGSALVEPGFDHSRHITQFSGPGRLSKQVVFPHPLPVGNPGSSLSDGLFQQGFQPCSDI